MTRLPEAFYVFAHELFGLSGFQIPEIDYPQRAQMAVYVEPQGNGLIRISGSNPGSITLDPNHVFRLTNKGEVARVFGPDDYPDPIAKIVAQTSIKPEYVIQRYDHEIFLDRPGLATVLLANGKVRETGHSVQRGYGLAAVVRYGWRITEIVIRHDGLKNPLTARFIASQLQPIMRKPSGIFAQAQRNAWEPWVLKAATEFYEQRQPVNIPAPLPLTPSLATA